MFYMEGCMVFNEKLIILKEVFVSAYTEGIIDKSITKNYLFIFLGGFILSISFWVHNYRVYHTA